MKAETAAMIMMSGTPDLEDITFTENGVYESEDHDGFSQVTVSIPLTSTSFTQNGSYTNSEGGWNAVTVNVRSYYDEYQAALTRIDELEDDLANMGTKTITVNGTYSAETDGFTGYSAVTVNVPQSAAVTDQLSVTANGTYTPPQGVDGYDEVSVNVPTHEEEVEELQKCQQLVVNMLKGYLPDFDPQSCTDIADALSDLYDEGYEDGGGTGTPTKIKPLYKQGSDGVYYTITVEIFEGANNTYLEGDNCPYLSYHNMILQPRTAISSPHYPEWYRNLFFKITINGEIFYSAYNFGDYYRDGTYLIDAWIANGNQLYIKWYDAHDDNIREYFWWVTV